MPFRFSKEVIITVNQALLPTAEDVAFFRNTGYWLAGKIVDGRRLERLRQAMDDVYTGVHETGHEPWHGGWKPGGDPMQIRKTDNSHWSNLALRELATNSTIGAIAARLMDTPQVRLWHDQLLYKPGAGDASAVTSGNVGWHQDNQYWQCVDPDLITAWVAFDDVDEANGCMQVVPGSNHWGLLPDGNFFNHDLDDLQQRITGTSDKEFVTVPCRLHAGEVSFHHCRTIHGSGPNITDRPRRSLVVHVMPAHTHYIAATPSDGHMNVQLLKERGGKDGGRFADFAGRAGSALLGREEDLWPLLYTSR